MEMLNCISEDQLAPSASSSLLPGMGLEHGLPPVEEEKPKCKYRKKETKKDGQILNSQKQFTF